MMCQSSTNHHAIIASIIHPIIFTLQSNQGSGMIHPNMATMLSVLTCDVPVAAEVWRPLVKRAVQASFNQITVDGDTSTNDTVIALASGAAGGAAISDPSSKEAAELEARARTRNPEAESRRLTPRGHPALSRPLRLWPRTRITPRVV